jgi:hypothetical protein
VPRQPREVEQLLFAAGAPATVVAQMDRLARAGDGWLNLLPVSDDGDERPTTLRFWALLGGSDSGATMLTWIPSRADRRGTAPQTLGISHPGGYRAAPTLASADVRVPPTWTIEQDHPRRGLIVHPPAEEAPETVLTWAMRAVEVLDTSRRHTSWRADVHLPAP